MCQTGSPVKCGDIIRLEHMETQKNLHSHNVRSPLSGKNEVSGFGDEGEGDNGDDWKIECLSSSTGLIVTNGEEIKGSTVIQLRHDSTNTLLSCEKKNEFNNRNCPRCPIIGQLESNTQNRGSSAATRW